MKKRVLSALLVLCMACSLVSTALATDGQATPETADEPTATSRSAGEMATPETSQEEDLSVDPSAYPARTAEAKVDGTDATVQVDIPAGSLPEDATLTAALIGSSEDDGAAVADVAAELEEAQVDYDGFVALDISFKDAEGNEVEPLQPVSVSFTLPAALLPADADPATLEVQHLEENEAGEVTDVVPVADVADETEGTVTVEAPAATLSAAPAAEDEVPAMPENAEVTAEFTVDRFSTFTITWQGDGNSGDIVHHELKAICVDESGQQIGPVDFTKVYTYYTWLSSGSNELLINDIAPVFKGYDFQRAEITDNNNQIYEVEKIRDNKTIIFLSDFEAFYDGEWHDVGDNEIRFVYRKDETGTGGTGVPATLGHKKYISANDDGTYNLNLDVVGSVGSEENKAQVDVVFVLDMSSSMNYGLNGESGTAFSKTRIKLASDAIRSMAESLTLNDNLDAEFALAKFGSAGMDSMTWTGEPTVLLNALPTEVSSGQGTNYEAGLKSAKELLENSQRPNATKIIVFVSDGNPTHYGSGTEDERDDSGAIPMKVAKDVLGTMSDIDQFYAVGVGPRSGYNRLSELLDAVVEGVETKPVFAGEDEASLSQAFADIESAITYISCTYVQITDVLSDNVAVEMDAVSGAPKLDITVCDANGTEVSSTPTYSDGKIQVEFTAPVIKEDGNTENKNITVTARTEENAEGKTQIVLDFPDDYQLNQNWSYMVTATVSATQAAYDAYAKNGYTDKGEAGTGTTSEGKDGLFSNDSATLTYQVSGETKNEPYAKPVIQLTPNTLTIEKTFKDLDEEQIEALTGLSFEVTLTNDAFAVGDGITNVDGKRTQTVTFATSGDDAFTKKEGNGFTYVYSIPGISPNTRYSVKEVGGALDGYEVQVAPGDTASGTFGEGGNETKTASFTNTYTEKPKYANLTIDKDLSSNVTENITQTFTFTIEKTDGDIADGTTFDDVVFNDNKATVKIQGDGQKVIENLPLGKYTVTETSPADIDLKVIGLSTCAEAETNGRVVIFGRLDRMS